MKKSLLFIMLGALVSCASVDSIHKNANCVVWKDQQYWGPYSIEVVENKIFWNGNCKGYNSGCKELSLKVDENKNLLSDEAVIGTIANNELKLAEKHALATMINYNVMSANMEGKQLKTQTAATEPFVDSYKFNDKCSAESALLGGVALDAIYFLQINK
ncbi:hypothetical protein DOM21_15765 [Bacteriovorax stolpii]|uniref:Uncharacterized protein n=1 Tax=Bacteriovorax stolpii TaxID=960 RepID=A0A2K9NNS8_BACTC|nr:hypothetical protein [Bacteriovorax stolpii]AUN97180.1 hypothetical protein C0V70_03460 [Bacteriovorax stolpii]QDK42881.1 hypothetical protein DOM21_15765 [Bacteriovorax stolpii]TDP53467.1 hypothetical protein C8D79_2111 [Bacteriovorax stolpii]